MQQSTLHRLVEASLGATRAEAALGALVVDPAIVTQKAETASRGVIAMALNVLLLDDVLARVPSGRAYVDASVAAGQPILFDHGALRTIRFPEGDTGALPAGHEAFGRFLRPLGYEMVKVYPLPRLKMAGHVYCHVDFPETVPQFFVSELYVDQFEGEAFAAAAHRAFDSSRDPLTPEAMAILARLESEGALPFREAALLLPVLARAFGCHHDPVRVEDYETLKAQSAEAAWIATEGNAFNHATDRVADVDALAARLKAEGLPLKETVEVSASGRVRQTATRADEVEREMIDAAGGSVIRKVPGSFHEFITRAIDPETGRLDLGFDAGNATGIFAMTRAA